MVKRKGGRYMNDLRPFRFWCQKVLPLVYDDSLSYYELLCKVVDYLNKTMENVNNLSENFDELQSAFNTLKKYIEEYFENLDVQEEINKKLDEMAQDGTLAHLVYDKLKLVDKVDSWLYAQQDTNEKSAQGFTIFNYGGATLCACCSDGAIYIRNLLTGELINTITNEIITHVNDITYFNHKLYFVNGDDTNIHIIDLYDYSTSTFHFKSEDMTFHGIEYYLGNFYFLCKSSYENRYYISKFDTFFSNGTEIGNVNYGENISAKQGIFIHNEYLFLVGSRNNRTDIQGWYNILNVYNVNDCAFVKNIYVPFGMELEGVGYYNKEFYFYYNCFSQAGVITKGNLFYSEESYGVYPEHKLGFGRFNNSVNMYINENYAGFFLDNTEEHPFKYWSEANAFMINYDVPYYHLFLLSDINSRDLTANSNREKALGIYSNNGVNINVAIDFRQFTNLHFSKINFKVDGSINQCNRVLFDECNINSTINISRASSLEFNSTNIMHNITTSFVTNILLSGSYTAINNCIDSDRLISGVRVNTLPTNINEMGLWKILTTGCNKYILSTIEMCKKINDKHGAENQVSLYLTDSDNILDLNISGNYLLGSKHSVTNAPDNRKSTLYLKNVYGIKYFTYKNADNTDVYYRTVDTKSNYDSNWFNPNEIYNHKDKVVPPGNYKPFTPENCVNLNSYGNSYYIKTNTLVQLHIGVSGLSPNTDIKIFTLPQGYRPVSVIIGDPHTSSANTIAKYTINTDGSIYCYTNSATNITFDVTFNASY
jgi:hypothetical protein